MIRRGRGREKNWQVQSVTGGFAFATVCVKSLWNRLNNFKELLPTSAVIYSPVAGLSFCQIESVF